MPRQSRALLFGTVLAILFSAANASTVAFGRASVLGRANGAAIACRVPEAERAQFRALAEKELQKLARSSEDLSDATTRMTLDTVKARSAVERGSISCADALWFYEDQLKSLKRSNR